MASLTTFRNIRSDNDLLQVKKTYLTSNDLLNCFTTPINVVDAPGPGKVLSFQSATSHFIYGTIPYIQPGPIRLWVGVGITAVVANIGLINGVTDLITLSSPPASVTLTENSPIFLQSLSGNPTTGDGTMEITVYYIVTEV